MRLATAKRDRKYGKKAEEIVEKVIIKKKKKKIVKVIVDYGSIREFPSREAADKYIDIKNKEADRSNRPRTSFTYV